MSRTPLPILPYQHSPNSTLFSFPFWGLCIVKSVKSCDRPFGISGVLATSPTLARFGLSLRCPYWWWPSFALFVVRAACSPTLGSLSRQSSSLSHFRLTVIRANRRSPSSFVHFGHPTSLPSSSLYSPQWSSPRLCIAVFLPLIVICPSWSSAPVHPFRSHTVVFVVVRILPAFGCPALS